MIIATEPRFKADSDNETLQNAIDAVVNDPDRTVCIPKHPERDEWVIEKSLLLPSFITVVLDDCHLTLADGIYDNIFRNRNLYNDSSLQSNIHIKGKGNAILDGGNPNDLTESTSSKDGRPHIRFNNLVLLNNVCDYSIDNLTCRNMRYWAINQIACTNGHISNIRFESGRYVPNQDGINFRIGCSHCTVENISGQTGDDTVALSAFPCGNDGKLLPPSMSPDIHDITVRNVSSCTHQTIVALRNTDGARLYNVTVQNVEDNGGEYRPWGVVRIGENAYFRNRPTLHGDVENIVVDNVRSLAKGTVFINMTLKSSVIRNVLAGGTSMYAISTFYPVSATEPDLTKDGVTLENVVFENIHYNGTAEHLGSRYLNVVGSNYSGAALDFRCMRDTDTISNVICRNVTWRDGAVRLASTRPLPFDFED